MGQRTVASAPVAPASRSLAAGLGWALLGGLLLALAAAAFAVAPERSAGLLSRPLVGVALVAASAVAAAAALRRRLGPVAPLWIAVWVFASVVPAGALWTAERLLPMAAVALAFALLEWRAAPPPPLAELPDMWPDSAPSGLSRQAVDPLAGLLLGVAIAAHPLYLVLLLPPIVLAPAPRRRAIALLLVGAAASAAAITFLVGDPAGWIADLRVPRLDLALLAADVKYVFIGRHVGVLPYFFPVFLALAALGRDARRATFFVAALIGVLGFVVLRPFDFIRGPHAIANAAFLPLYPALWFWAGRRGKALPAVLVAGLALPWLLPLLRTPLESPFAPDGSWRYVAPQAERWLPMETTLRTLPGSTDAVSGALRLRLLEGVRAEPGRMTLHGGETGRVLVVSPVPVAAFQVEFDGSASTRLEAEGAEVGAMTLRPGGGVGFTLVPKRPSAVHPMWWTHERQYVYALGLRLDGAPPVPIGFHLTLAAEGGAG